MPKRERANLGPAVQLEIPGDHLTTQRLPAAAKQQLRSSDWDDALTVLARANHPGVFWWWGTRAKDDTAGAYCYICDSFIAHFSRRYGIPQAQLAEIDQHRIMHYQAIKQGTESS